MAELAKPYPGWKPPWIGSEGECLRQAYACAAGKHPIKLRYIDPVNLSVWEFWREWEELSCEQGMKLVQLFNRDFEGGIGSPWPVPDDALWIAGVQSKLTPGARAKHAIVMRGQEFYWDSSPNHARVRKPRVIYWGYGLEPVVPA